MFSTDRLLHLSCFSGTLSFGDVYLASSSLSFSHQLNPYRRVTSTYPLVHEQMRSLYMCSPGRKKTIHVYALAVRRRALTKIVFSPWA